MKFIDVRFPARLIMMDEWDKNWSLYEPFYVEWLDGVHRLNAIEVPAGFVNDLASVPWMFRWFVSKVGNHNAASVVHDYLYEKRGDVNAIVDGGTLHKRFSRKDSDDLFYAGIKTRGLGVIKAWLMYMAVRVGGGKTWRT